MAISFVGAETGGAFGTAVTVNVPSGVQDGDVLIAWAGYGADGPTSVTGGLATQVFLEDETAGFDHTCHLAYQVASSEPASYTFQFNSGLTDDTVWGHIVAYRGVDNTTPLDVTFVDANHRTAYTNDSTPTCPAITTNTDNAWVICLQFASGSSITNMVDGGDKTERSQIISQNDNSNICDAIQATAGTFTPNAQGHVGAAGTEDGQTATIALKVSTDSITPQAMYHYRHHGK